MPSIYTNLKKSDKKHIRTEKARIRRQFLDVAKQEEMITELYKKMVPAQILGEARPEGRPAAALNPKSETLNSKQIKKPNAKKTEKLEAKAVKPKKAAVKKVKA